MSEDLTTAKNTFFKKKHLLNCRGKVVDLSTPRIMGILNLTPDSFYNAGKLKEIGQILNYVEKMLENGADIIDVGAVSSRPRAPEVSEEEEKRRLFPFLGQLIEKFPECIVSVDTFRSSIAEQSLQAGVSIINDIYGGSYDERIMEVVASYSAPLIIMHMQNTPQNMQEKPEYGNVVLEVADFLMNQSYKAIKTGIKDIIIDPGFGFGKSVTHNYQLLNHLAYLSKLFEYPLLVGVSRKSMVTNLLNIKTMDSLNGTTAVHMLALVKGADILRVHDVKAAREAITVFTESEKSVACQ